MAQPKTFNGAKILIKVGDGDDPEVFAHPCLINSSRGLQWSATTVDSVVPDCADMGAPAWTEREKDALSLTITGEGVMDSDSIADYIDWLKAEASKNLEVIVDDGGDGSQKLTGAFHLTEFQLSGDRKEKTQASITLVSNGPVANADVA